MSILFYSCENSVHKKVFFGYEFEFKFSDIEYSCLDMKVDSDMLSEKGENKSIVCEFKNGALIVFTNTSIRRRGRTLEDDLNRIIKARESENISINWLSKEVITTNGNNMIKIESEFRENYNLTVYVMENGREMNFSLDCPTKKKDVIREFKDIIESINYIGNKG